MPTITAETANGQVAFEGEKGRKLVLCLEDNGVDILHKCGGNARCTTCRVEIISGDPGEVGEAEKNNPCGKNRPWRSYETFVSGSCKRRFAR